MTFLTPIAGITAAAVSLPVLVAFYLLKLRRRPVRISSTMLWEGAVRDVQVNVPLRLLRPSWMLLLHLLVLALFVLAIARPVIDAPGVRTRRVILLVDRSASMNATDAGGSRLDAAKARAGEIVRTFASERPEFTVVAYAADAVVVGRPADAPDEVARQLASIDPTDQPDDIERALTLVGSLARDAGVTDEGAPAPPLVVVLSDGGRLADHPLALAGGEARYERIGPDPDADRRNTGIAAIAAERDADDPVLARVFVRLINASRDPVAVPVVVSVDGSEVERTAVRLPGAGETEPGELGRTFEVRVPSAAVVEVRLDRSDALGADDDASVVIPAARLPSVLLVAPGDEGDPKPDAFLLDVLNEMRLGQLRTVSPETYARFAGSLGAFDVVVFDRVSPGARPPIPSLSFGAAPPGLSDGPVRTTGTTRIIDWDRDHPALADLTLEPLVIGERIALPERAPAGYDDLRVLARTPDAPVMIEATVGGVRHVVVGFGVAQSNWPVHFGFPIFVAATIERLAPRAGAASGESFTTGEPARARAPAGTDEVRLSGPVDRVARAASPGGWAELGDLPRVGVYRVRGGAGADGSVAVNLADAAESALATHDRVVLAGEPTESSTGERAGPRELWPALVLAAFVLLLLDWALYTMLMRV